ncbi:ABC transporter permease [Iodidimonas muriae]|nr:iron ABC transporter permease [Iodidimonas muriae]
MSRIFSLDGLLFFGVLLLIGLPVTTVVAHLFMAGGDSWAHLMATVLPRYIANSLWLVMGVGLGTFLVGTGAAWLVTLFDFPGRRQFEWAMILPLSVPAYVLAYAYTDFLQVAGPVQSLLRDLTGWGPRDYWFPEIRSLGGAIWLFVLALYPYVYLAGRSAFLQQSECVVEASRTLGCTSWTAFIRVALPLARPALAAGVALACMETLADFGAVSYFGVQTFTTGIYRTWFSFGDRVAAAQLASLLLGFVALLLLAERISRKGARYHETSRRIRPLGIQKLFGWRAALAAFVCFLPLLFGFVLPGAILVTLALDVGDAQLGGRYLGLIRNSVSLAALTAALAVVLALAISYMMRTNRSAVARSTAWIAGLGYAIPGSIIAVGVLIPLAWFDNRLDAFMRSQFDLSTGLLLTGSITALVFAYLVRFLALAQQTTRAGLEKITPSMDAAAATLGAGRFQALRKVHAPLLKGPLLTAFLLVFVEVMKELPATMIMRPFNFDTLAVQAHNLAADERLAEAATPALTIVIVGLIPVVILTRLIGQSRPGQPTGSTIRTAFSSFWPRVKAAGSGK